MEATTPTESRRIIEVWPGRYSPASMPCGTLTAPAKKRKQSTMAGISSRSTAVRGLPQFKDSSAAKASASASMRSASFRSRPERAAGVVRDHAANAAPAAFTAWST